MKFIGKSAKFRLQLSACPFLCVCVSATSVSIGSTLAKIKQVKNDVCRFQNFLSNGVIVKTVHSYLDLLSEGQRFASRSSHSGECHSSITTASTAVLLRNSLAGQLTYSSKPHSSITTASTVVLLRNSLAGQLTYSSKPPFKQDECRFQCEVDICSTTSGQLTHHMCARLLKVVLPDSVPFLCTAFKGYAKVLAIQLSCPILKVVLPDSVPFLCTAFEGYAKVLTIQLSCSILKVKVNRNSIVKNLETESSRISP